MPIISMGKGVTDIVAEIASERLVERIMHGVIRHRGLSLDEDTRKDIVQDIYLFLLGYDTRLLVAKERGRLTELVFWTVDNFLKPKSKALYRSRILHQCTRAELMDDMMTNEDWENIIG